MFRCQTLCKTIIVFMALLVLTTACSWRRSTNTNQPANQAANKQSVTQTETAKPPADPNGLRPGEASGSYTAKGETVNLRYAYAGRAKRFDEDSIVILLTDQPIPAEAVADEIKSQTLLLGEKIRGLEYAISKDGFWVRFHPSQYQESRPGQIKEYSVENDTVRGFDEDKGDVTDGKYSRAVKFVATIK
jgi:hypothetical protein